MLNKANEIAAIAHIGQVDKAGSIKDSEFIAKWIAR